LSVGCGIGLREAEVPTPALLIVDLRFSIARPSLDFQSKVPSRNRRKYWPGIFFNVSASLGRDAVDPHHREKSLRLVKARRETIFYSGLRVLTQFPTQL
jgi:hypothetical protein